MKNQMRIFFDAVSENEAFARLVAAGFFAQLNPTLAEITDVKTAVSEAVTNAIIHGYEGKGGTVELFCAYDENRLQKWLTEALASRTLRRQWNLCIHQSLN